MPPFSTPAVSPFTNHYRSDGGSMMRVPPFMWMLCIVLLVMLACGSEKNAGITQPSALLESAVPQAGQTPGTMSISFTFQKKTGKFAAKLAVTEAITTVTAYIYKQNGTLIAQQNLSIVDGFASGIISIPAPDTVKVVVVFYDGSMVRWAGEQTYVTITPGQNSEVSIAEMFIGVSCGASPTEVAPNTPYTLSWESVPYATTYELWESADQAAGTGSAIYSGPLFEYQVAGKAGEGTYYYRVRAITSYGAGPFYSVGYSTVSITNSGGVNIYVPIPGDEPS